MNDNRVIGQLTKALAVNEKILNLANDNLCLKDELNYLREEGNSLKKDFAEQQNILNEFKEVVLKMASYLKNINKLSNLRAKHSDDELLLLVSMLMDQDKYDFDIKKLTRYGLALDPSRIKEELIEDMGEI